MKCKFKQQASYWLIHGVPGCGKTILMQKCAEEKARNNIDYRYIKFTKETKHNTSEIISSIFFVFFPFAYMDDITVEYLTSLEIDSRLKKMLCHLKESLTIEDELVKYIHTLNLEETKLSFSKLQITKKIIAFDDVHLLNDNNIQFLFFLLKITQKLPIMYILASHSYFMDNSIYKLYNNEFIFEKYQLELTINDIISNIKYLFSFSFDITNNLIEYFFPNIIVFNIFINYVKDLENSINTLDDFIINYIAFKQHYIADEYINSQFNRTFEKYPTSKKVCDEIYSQIKEIIISKYNKKDIGYLLTAGLIKYDEFNHLVPKNEIYSIHYRKKYNYTMDDKYYVTDKNTLVGSMIFKLSNMLLPNELEYYYNEIHKMRSEEKFQSINYILENVFENSSLEKYKNIWGEELFYLLYFEYTYAAINCNNMVTGYDNLQYIYEHIKGTSSTRLSLLILEIIFELINCDYNDGKYSKCKEYYEIFDRHFYILTKKGIVENNPKKNLFYVLSMGYMILIDAEDAYENAIIKAEKHKDFLLENYPFHYIDFCRQFSKTLYIRDWDLACDWQKLAYDEVIKRGKSESKQALKVEFDFYFTQYLKTENNDYINKMEKIMSVAKYKIYSSYRHQLFLYCGLLYILNSIDEADTLFIRDVTSLRPIRPKMKGHYHSLLAIHFLKHRKLDEAKEHIEKACDFFNELKSYRQIAQHNTNVLNNIPLKQIEFKFCMSPLLKTDTFYLDPRM